MKKKILLVSIIVILIVIIGLVVAYLIDMDRIKNNKPVVFGTWGYDYVPPVGISEDYDLRYDSSFVINNGDIIINQRLLDDFIANTNAYAQDRKTSSLRILRATIEGDYIVTDIEYNQKRNEYKVTIDSSKDTFANTEQRQNKSINVYSGEIYNIVKQEENNMYVIKLVPKELIEFTEIPADVHICEYSKDSKDVLEFKFIATIIEETDSDIIVRPNDDEDEIKSSDKFYIKIGDNKDYIYGVGRKVLITYTGNIMETYPAQIDAIDISTEGYSDFEISVVQSKKDAKKVKILNNQDLYELNSKYNLYYYGLDEVNVKVDDKIMKLEDALKLGKITIDGVILKANNEVKETQEKYSEFEEHQSVPRLFPYMEMYKDGGSIIYYYETYTILKNHTLDGNRDVYIGIPEMNINIRN